MKAVWKDTVIAESDDIVTVEGNAYFPPEAIVGEHFRTNDHTTVCPWKGTASYYDVVVGDDVNPAAAWYYPDPHKAAERVRGRIAFWKGVQVTR